MEYSEMMNQKPDSLNLGLPNQYLQQEQSLLWCSQENLNVKYVCDQHIVLQKTKVGYNTQIVPLYHETEIDLSQNKKVTTHVGQTLLDHNMLLM